MTEREEISNELWQMSQEFLRARSDDDHVHLLAQLEAVSERFRRLINPILIKNLREAREEMLVAREVLRAKATVVPFRRKRH